ncbi:MAG TPA: hypothetical protein VK116_09700, partial [Planctomycetota bacterium]|nr:hypothetical protein [Planctomycetota bacterium]
MSAIIALPLAADDVTLRRGDVTLDSAVDVSDAIAEIGYLFLGSTLASCDPVADVNADRNVDVSDPLFLLTHLFSHGPSPRPLDAVELEACGLVSVELAILAKPQEELSPIEIPLADGTGFVGEGIGLVEGEGTIEVTVPDGVSIL